MLEKRSMWYVILIAASAGVAGLLYGFDTAVISGAIGYLQDLYDLSPAMEGWVISCVMVGGVIGVAMSGFLSDRYGRKNIMIVSAVLFIISAIASAFATSVTMLVWARIIGGFGIGFASALSVTYISECAPPAIRGRLGSLYQLFTIFGICATFYINYGVANSGSYEWGMEVGWRWMLGYGVIPGIIFLILLVFVPESPRYLIQKGRDSEAFKTLSRINGDEIAKKETQEIKISIETEKNTSVKQLLKPGLRMAMGVGIFLALFNQVIGMNAVTYYGPDIFRRVGFENNTEFLATSIIGSVQVVFTIIAILLIDRLGRKKLMAIGSSLMAIFMVLIGSVFFFEPTNSGPLLVIFIAGFTASFCISMGPIPWIMIPEIFPNHIRGKAVGIATMFLWGANWAIGQFTPMLINNMGGAFTFWIFAVINVICFVFVMTIVPETKNKSLEEIAELWKPKNKNGKLSDEFQTDLAADSRG
ncbi:sugar porter family MFS transporter [Lederbergia galactosidilytica]|uniref:MFS transporter n=2 Tax=Lederbergia galactosidilytica TaxID=217031 RepID=A0A178A197_9BACI|nr:sugar porter family MFS transporter [Lederbergia galactosidilytica]KRG12270.1 MFS transporter [Virgibacillus soli]MBP1913928.1 SP family arabinose:H+ symporter-like MFS transporter [Lederbergia galactosidilytica]OAK73966.1 MFS transporter [Lederbergia galactosidilytica]